MGLYDYYLKNVTSHFWLIILNPSFSLNCFSGMLISTAVTRQCAVWVGGVASTGFLNKCTWGSLAIAQMGFQSKSSFSSHMKGYYGGESTTILNHGLSHCSGSLSNQIVPNRRVSHKGWIVLYDNISDEWKCMFYALSSVMELHIASLHWNNSGLEWEHWHQPLLKLYLYNYLCGKKEKGSWILIQVAGGAVVRSAVKDNEATPSDLWIEQHYGIRVGFTWLDGEVVAGNARTLLRKGNHITVDFFVGSKATYKNRVVKGATPSCARWLEEEQNEPLL